MKNNYCKTYSNETAALSAMRLKNQCNLVKGLLYVVIVTANEQYAVTTLRQAIEIGNGYKF